MQAIVKMIRFLLRLSYRAFVVYAVFVLIAWLMLGDNPLVTLSKTSTHLNRVWSSVVGFSSDVAVAGRGLHKLGETHINEAKDRYHGIDAYHDIDQRLSKELQK